MHNLFFFQKSSWLFGVQFMLIVGRRWSTPLISVNTKKLLILFIIFTGYYHFSEYFSTGTQPLVINCPATQSGQYQCSAPTATVNFPVATVTGGSGTVSAVTYSATGSTFTAPANNQVTGTFPTSPSSQTVTASVTDSAGTLTCIFLVQVTQGNNCNINESATLGSKMEIGFYWSLR